MPTIQALGKTIECDQGANLRQVLLNAGIELYNGKAKLINCRGIGTCGTCAVAVDGEVSPPNWRDKTRRSLPPHSPAKNLRLACQTEVLGDLKVTKYDGFWGQGERILWTPDAPSPQDSTT
ncbi:2Fe-2S iron-sulfur cluster-binding protein [Phormidium sp. CCY1219]|uniref:2Fe-2S iron-sulfur cluster-binding protein n=1 Tax=Phormidium sp. CCY1219 TaxID=2886104 RepID=UPI002D1F29E2|nr:2Fe-2S iron-sulfur cluster-binding protein [Phormidium sp. CCY1219]MEB3829353.1 (2Fe-2S)-binding protein [Phormidium sp. CCY1219]